MKGPICFFGKFTTPTTSRPTSSSGEYSAVICALDLRMPISGPKSTCRMMAGLRACGNGSSDRTLPTRRLSFMKSSQVICCIPALHVPAVQRHALEFVEVHAVQAAEVDRGHLR